MSALGKALISLADDIIGALVDRHVRRLGKAARGRMKQRTERTAVELGLTQRCGLPLPRALQVIVRMMQPL
jgi:hypothetical protein